MAKKLLESILNSKDSTLITFLSSLGIIGGAYNKCEKVVNSGFDTIDKILDLNESDLMKIEGFAQKSAKTFLDSLIEKKELIQILIEKGFKLSHDNKKDLKLGGLNICITGTLSMKRSDLEKILKDKGAVIASSVTKKTDFLITNDTTSNSSKLKKAAKHQTIIITEEDFYKKFEIME